MSEDESSHDGSESHRLFVVSACSASETASWSEQGFVIRHDLAGSGIADAVFVDRVGTDDGSVETDTSSENHDCSVSLDAGTFTIAETGPVGDDARPSTLVLMHGEEGRHRMELTAAIPIADLEFGDFARDTATREDEESALESEDTSQGE